MFRLVIILFFIGFQKMLQKFERDDKLFDSFQELFPSLSAAEKGDKVVMLTKAYHNYKRKYVKHLSFNPGEENLSKVIYID